MKGTGKEPGKSQKSESEKIEKTNLKLCSGEYVLNLNKNKLGQLVQKMISNREILKKIFFRLLSSLKAQIPTEVHKKLGKPRHLH